MAGFMPVLHDFNPLKACKSWMTGTRPVMTEWQRSPKTAYSAAISSNVSIAVSNASRTSGAPI
jgi:hypothetical protein